jgi:membrane protein DedA with SNARE-associated domain
MDAPVEYLTVGALAAISWFGISGPGDAALVAASIWAAQGKLDMALVMTSAFLGAEIGGAVGYLVGLHGGRPLILRPGPLFAFRQKAVVRGDRVVQRFGRLASITALPIVCGVNRVPLGTFVTFSTIGRLGWVLLTGFAAFYLGQAAVDQLRQVGVPVIATILVIALVVFGVYYVWSQRHPTATEDDRGGPAAA